MWLVVVDTMQIQPYIFGSNRLRENVGASYLVDAATRDWAFEAVKAAVPGETNIGPGNKLIDDKRIENGLDAEVLYGCHPVFCVKLSAKQAGKEVRAA
jgi:hypothetical protein